MRRSRRDDGDREWRRELSLRLSERLREEAGFEWESKVSLDDSTSVKLTYRELAELVGALGDSGALEYVKLELHDRIKDSRIHER